MFFHSLQKSEDSANARARKPGCFVPGVESLEDRLAPSAALWDGIQPNTSLGISRTGTDLVPTAFGISRTGTDLVPGDAGVVRGISVTDDNLQAKLTRSGRDLASDTRDQFQQVNHHLATPRCPALPGMVGPSS